MPRPRLGKTWSVPGFRAVRGSWRLRRRGYGPIFGPIIPNMGPKVRLGDALFSGVQQGELAALFGLPERSFYRNGLLQLTKSGKGALEREVEVLEPSGLVTVRSPSNHRPY